MRDDIRDAISLLNSHGIPAMRSKDPGYLVFEVGESVFRALLPADPTRAAGLLINAVGDRGKILDDYRKAIQGLGRFESLPADDVAWDDLFSNGDPVETGAVIFQSQGAEDHPISLDLLIMSDGTWQPDGFDSDREGTAADVRDYLAQWGGGAIMNVERIIVETNDETCDNPVEYDWEFDPDGVSRMTGEGDIPSGADDSTAIVEAFGHIAESIVDGERIASGGDAKWLRPLAAMLAARIPFVSGSVESGLSVDVTSSEFLDCCRSVWIGADMHRGFGRYLNLRWDVGRREWVEAGSGFAFVGADSQVAFMLETAMAENDGIRFDPMEGEEDAIQLFRLLLETAKSADIPVGWET